jgi:hypothetical protein
MKCTFGDNKMIDHINGNTTDVRIKNLRETNEYLNSKNRGPTKEFIGIKIKGKKWEASIVNNDGEKVHLGTHKTPEDAARAYDEAAKKLKVKRLNFEPKEEYIGRGIDDNLFELFKSTFLGYDENKLREFAEDVCKLSWERAQMVPPFPVRPKVEDIPFTQPKCQSEPLQQGQKFIKLHGKHGNGCNLRCSEEDFEMLSKYKWTVSRDRDGYESVSASAGKGKCVSAHRLVLSAIRGDGIIVDHRNSDTLNVTRGNLRQINRVENSQNQGPKKNSSSNSVGVCYDKSSKKWKAQIMINGKRTNLGRFKEEKDAVKARDDAVIKHGLNNRLNNPVS